MAMSAGLNDWRGIIYFRNEMKSKLSDYECVAKKIPRNFPVISFHRANRPLPIPIHGRLFFPLKVWIHCLDCANAEVSSRQNPLPGCRYLKHEAPDNQISQPLLIFLLPRPPSSIKPLPSVKSLPSHNSSQPVIIDKIQTTFSNS